MNDVWLIQRVNRAVHPIILDIIRTYLFVFASTTAIAVIL